MAKGTVRITFSIPVSMREDLDYIAAKMGISKSALLTSLSSEPLSDLAQLLKQVPDSPTESEVLRLRGASIALVEERMESLRKLENDLFSKK